MITVGEVLKKQRKNLNKSIEQVALDTKIQPRFIKYIEENDFEKFDSSVYAQGFIKIYAKYLNLNEDRILAIYRRSVPNIEKPQQTMRETKNVSGSKRITPKTITIALSVFFFLIVGSYISYQIYQFQSPPQIDIQTPEDNLSVQQDSIEVKGVTDTNSTLFINDTPVELNDNGEFSKNIELNPGVNLITILAKKDNSTQESIETIKINYNLPENQENKDDENEEKEQTPNIVKLEIVNSSVWVQFNVDKENKVSQIVQAGEQYQYEVENQFSLTTGIITSTKLYFNDKEIDISTNSSNVGSVTCKIENKDQINCQ
jgi:cytoskeleton protein RodZ